MKICKARHTWRPACQVLLLFWVAAASVQAQPLPQEGLYTEILANTRNVDMGTPVWVPVSLDDQLLDPTLSDELTSPYQDLPLFDINTRSSYFTGLGVLSVAGLGLINDALPVFPIRSNALVRARHVRHFTAHSPDGSPVPGGLLMSADGTMGYETVDTPGAPYAFERILDAVLTLEVKLYRTGQAPTTIWSGVTSIIKSEDVDLPMNILGDFKPHHWSEGGPATDRAAALNLLEPYLDRFTVNDGETFALEFIMEVSTRNYEYPNWEAYVRMFNTSRINPVAIASGHFLESILIPESLVIDFPATRAASRVGPTEQEAEESIIWQDRPDAFSPLVNNEFSAGLEHPDGSVNLLARDISSVNPFGAFGSLGAQSLVTVTPAEQVVSPDRSEYSAYAQPFYSVAYVPGTGGASPPTIDIDFDLVLDGTLEVKARDAAAFTALAGQGMAGAMTELHILASINTPGRFVSMLGFKVMFNGDSVQTVFVNDEPSQISSQFMFTPIPDSGPQTGGRLTIDLDTRLLPANDPLVLALQDVVTITPGEYVIVHMQLSTKAFVDETDVALVERVDANFFNTMQPILSTDTPGVVLVIADEEGLSEFIFDDGFEDPPAP